MPPDLLVTKHHLPPGRPEHVARPRLLARLELGLEGKLTLLSAPAGYGKTTLLSNWLSEQARPHAWLTLDEGDNDPARFFAYVVAALQGVDENIGRAVQSVLHTPQALPAETFVTAILNDIASLARPFILVLDDFHLISSAPCQRTVELLVRNMPRNMRLVIATREEPQLSLARLRVAGQLTEIRAEDLRFHSAETASFLRMAAPLELSRKEMEVLQARTEGWIAGLQLAALSMRGRDAAAVRRFIAAFGGSHRHVIDYLTEEVLGSLPVERRDFLVQTAVLDRLTGSLCDAVTGRSDGEETLRQLEDANLFLVPIDEGRTWFRYHGLFAGYLQTELDQQQRQTAHSRAARWFEAHGHLSEAVGHLLAAGDTSGAAVLVARAGYHEFQRGGLVTLSGWLDALPEETILESAALTAFRALTSFILTQSTDAQHYLRVLEERMSPDDPPAVRGRLVGMKAWVASRKGDLDEAVRLGQQASRMLEEEDAFAGSFALVALGQSYEARGETAAAAGAYHRAWKMAGRAGSPFAAMLAQLNLALSLDALGRRREGVALCRQCLEGSQAGHGEMELVAQMMHLPLGVLHYRANELEEAVTSLREGLDACARLGLGSSLLVGRYYLGRTLLAAGDLRGAQRLAAGGRHVDLMPGQEPDQKILGDALRAEAALQQGNLEVAERWAASLATANSLTGEGQARTLGARATWHDESLLTLVRILVARDRLSEAKGFLESLEKRLETSGQWGTMITVLVQLALVALKSGNRDEALTSLEEAIRAAAVEGIVRPFVEAGPAIGGLLREARPRAPAFIDEILGAASRETAGRPPAPPSLLDPLTPRELEVLAMIAQGHSNQEIAGLLFVAVSTVKKHINRIFSKLDARDRTHAVLRARELGQLPIRSSDASDRRS